MNSTDFQLCPNFGKCGGCQTMDQPYADQLAYKNTYVRNLLAQFHPQQYFDIVPSPKIEYFRNKMEFAVSGTVEDPKVGLRPAKKFSEVIDITECKVFYPGAGEVLQIVRQWISDFGIQPYDLKIRKGELRYVSMRHTKAYDEVMVILAAALTTEQFEQKREAFVRITEDLKKIKNITSIYACLNTGGSDEALSGRMILLHGTPGIREEINAIDYAISPMSFFQTNPYCCRELYKIISEGPEIEGVPVLDLFCGCGGITLQACKTAKSVTGIDIVEQNIKDARDNSHKSGIKNASFICMDCQEFLTQSAESGSLAGYSTVIVDPPRQGLTKKDRKFILESGISNLIYVSCNPWNLVQDLKSLLSSYSLLSIQPVDMFPHTQHTETVARLIKQ